MTDENEGIFIFNDTGNSWDLADFHQPFA